MRKLVRSLAGLRHLRNSFRTGATVKSNARVGSLLFAATVSDSTISWEPAHSAAHFVNAKSPYLDRGESLHSASWRDVSELARDKIYKVHNRVNGFIDRSMETEGGRATVYITAINFAVYLLWKIAPTGFMVRHFANSLESIRRARIWTTVTSNFSHMGLLHLASNMYLLNRFGQDVAEILGIERFYVFYGAAGVASSLASLTFRRVTKSNVLSLGASGAVVATLWLYACFFPDRRMSILGSEKTLTMQELVLAYTVIDAAGLLGSSGKIDFAAHLGGAVFGNSWFHLVREKLVQEHAMRKNNEKRRIWGGLSEMPRRHSRSPSNEK